MTKKRLMAGAAVAGVLLSVVGGVGSAQAIIFGQFGINRISAVHNASTHQLAIKDLYSDGWGGYSDYVTANNAGVSGTAYNTNGYNTTTYTNIPNFGGQIYYNACAKDGSTSIGCSGVASSSI